MKRKRYWRLHPPKPFFTPIAKRSLAKLDENIQWCRDKLAEHGYFPMISNYLAELLVERANRFLYPHKRRRKH